MDCISRPHRVPFPSAEAERIVTAYFDRLEAAVRGVLERFGGVDVSGVPLERALDSYGGRRIALRNEPVYLHGHAERSGRDLLILLEAQHATGNLPGGLRGLVLEPGARAHFAPHAPRHERRAYPHWGELFHAARSRH